MYREKEKRLIQGDVSTEDLIFGAAVLAVLAPMVIGAGILLSRFKNARFTKAWAPLVPVIQGKVTGDGGGAATSWLSGTYKGLEMRASMTPNVAKVTGSPHRANRFEIVLLGARGREDWSVEWEGGVPGLVTAGWRIHKASPGLAERLQAWGVVDSIARLGGPGVEYRARDGALWLREDVAPLWIPPTERFRQELDTLWEVAAINARENPA
jgi:hypothetical protein